MTGQSTAITDADVTIARRTLIIDGNQYVMEHQEFVTVHGGRVAAIDSVCARARPAP